MSGTGRTIRLATANNDRRSVYLFEALRRKARVVVDCDFDPVGWLAKYSAALLSFSKDRGDWWNKYQWHPVIRRARERNLGKALMGHQETCDALILWGSWFNPSGVGLPFWPYIDQSCSATVDEGDVAGQNSMRARRAFTAYQGQTYRDAHGIFCMSNWAREQTLAAHRLPRSKVHYVGWGPCSVDLSAEETPLNTADPTVLFVGNDFHRKGADVLAAASAIVARRMPKTRFYIVGQHAENSRPPARDNVLFTGPIRDKNELRRLFRAATVFCLPARFDRSPHVLVEAMSAGNPIVATNVGGIPDAVIHEKTGLLIEKENPEALARALLAVLEHPELARAMGQAGKKVMLEHFTWEVVAERILSTIMAEQRLHGVTSSET